MKGKGGMNRISYLLQKVNTERGNSAEEKVEEALKAAGINYLRSEKWSKKDRRGIDFEISDGNGPSLLVDVKSSERGIREVVNHNNKHKTFVFPLLCQVQDTQEKILERIDILLKEHKKFLSEIKESGKRDLQNWKDPLFWIKVQKLQ